MESCSTRICKALQIRNMKQIELSEKTGIPKSAISQYCAGAFRPKQKRLFLIAQALQVDEAWLMGLDVPMDRSSDSSAYSSLAQDLTTEEQYLLQSYRSLNSAGQQKILDYTADLCASGRYIKTASDYLFPKQA